MDIKKGIFITFEGCDGVGKSTQLKVLGERLKSKNIPHVLTREPGGTKISESIRAILKDSHYNETLAFKTEILLLQAARAQHVHELIIPSLEEGKIVLCDRYIDSSVAYQGSGKDVSKEEIMRLNQFSTNGIIPDITFLLDLNPEDGLSRAESRLESFEKKDRFESKDICFHNSVRKMYLKLSQEEARFRVINAYRKGTEITQEIVEIISNEFNIFI